MLVVRELMFVVLVSVRRWKKKKMEETTEGDLRKRHVVFLLWITVGVYIVKKDGKKKGTGLFDPIKPV